MKRILYYTTTLLLCTTLFFSCKPNDKNLEDSLENAEETIGNSMENTSAQNSVELEKISGEYNDFKIHALEEMDENDQNLIKLREKVNEPGKVLDESRERRIEDLKTKNTELRERLNNYELNTSDWQSFKTRFNADLNSLGKTFSGFFSSDSKE